MPCYTTSLFVRCINIISKLEKLAILCLFDLFFLSAFTFRSNAEHSQILLAWKMCAGYFFIYTYILQLLLLLISPSFRSNAKSKEFWLLSFGIVFLMGFHNWFRCTNCCCFAILPIAVCLAHLAIIRFCWLWPQFIYAFKYANIHSNSSNLKILRVLHTFNNINNRITADSIKIY